MITPFHIESSRRKTGKGWKEVHEWLDMCSVDPFINFESYPMQHRIERHTKDGLTYIYEKWGMGGLYAAIYHLIEDGIWDPRMLPDKVRKMFKL